MSKRKRGNQARSHATGCDLKHPTDPPGVTLQQTLQELTHHIETSPLATVCWDREFRVTFWSQRAESMFGWAAEEVMGKTPFDWPFVFEADREQVNQAIAQLFSGVMSVCHNRNYRKDSSVVLCEWYNSTLLDEQGNLVSILSFALDVTKPKQAEAALLESETRFRTVVEYAPDVCVIYDRDCRFQYVNGRALERTGWTIDRFIGQRDEDLFPPEVTAEYLPILLRTIESRLFQSGEALIQLPGQEPYTILVKYVPILDQQGEIQQILGITTDISNRKRLEQELVKSRDFRELLFNESGDALFLVDSDTLLTTDCNQRAVELFEVASKAELIHIEGHIFQKHQFTPDEMAKIQREIDEKGYWSREVEYRTQRGREFWGDLSVKQLTFREQRFNLVRVSDISKRKAAEFALQQSEARYLSILEDQTELITRFQSDGTLVFVNDAFCRYYGVSRDEVIGTYYQPLIYPEDQPVINHCLSALSPENPVGSVEHRVFVNGTVRWMQWTNRAIYDPQGNLLELQSVGRDIDDRKQAELRVQATLAEKEILLQEVYHRVKNNLQLIQSMLQMQQRRLETPEAVQALQDSWNRVMTISLVHEILYQSDNLAHINLREYIPTLVQHIAASYHVTAPAVVVKTEVQSIIVSMKKAICCGLILNELVTNALKYAFTEKNAGQVTVKVSIDRTLSENTIVMTVRDNGIGLPKSVDLFGKTLGLTLVQDFVDQLRGAIAVESNQGCLFRVTFNQKP